MRNKGAIKFIAIALALVCIYQLSFTYVTKQVEKQALAYAKKHAIKNDERDFAKKQERFLDSVSTETVYNFLWVRKYTFKECKEREINLGLDLKGGMNVTLEVSVVELIKSLSNYSTEPSFLQAIKMAETMDPSKDFIVRFGEAFEKIAPNVRLASIFNTVELRDRISFNSTNKEVLAIISKEADGAIKNSFNIISTRIDKFGVSQPSIQQLENSGRILVQLPGIKEPERVRKLLQGTANLEFWETYENTEIYPLLEQANAKIKEIKDAEIALAETEKKSTETADQNKETATKEKGDDLVNMLKEKEGKDSTLANKDVARNYPLFSILNPSVDPRSGQPFGYAMIGRAHYKDTAQINQYLQLTQVKALFPRDLRLLWGVKAEDKAESIYNLYAIKVTTRNGKAPLDGGVITDARDEIADQKGGAEVTMAMNAEGARTWARLTGDNVDRCIAIVMDNYVYSAPKVNGEISGGRSSITGGFSISEAKDLANVLKSGKLPAPARIMQEEVVGPSLGSEAISAGMISFIIAFIIVLLYMIAFYHTAGWVANVALVANLFFLFGVLASLGAVLTLPGIAGIVLTMGMAVDANVIIYERIREELRAGKGLKLAIDDGFKHALSAIIDGNLTTILTGIVLYIFGSGPIQGFATTLIIGILTSLFCAIFISRLIFEWMLSKNMTIHFDNRWSRNFLLNVKIDFIGIRKKLYAVSIIVIVIGIGSLAMKGLNYGIDFTGGRTYIVRFDKDVKVADVRESLTKEFGDAPEVKTFGPASQVKITTKFMIDKNETSVDSLIETKLYSGLKNYYSQSLTFADFGTSNQNTGVLSSQKVGPTIAEDIKFGAILAVVFALISIFAYIAIRFKKWQWGMGGVVSLFHDSLIVISMYSIFYGILPFTLEVDQAFIAAILTIIGYSINDTVIIFDRIREYRTIHPKWELKDSINSAINSTLGRTFNTSMTTIVVLVAIFIFGGDVLRGFIFALLVGIGVGTYSSVFNATPVAYDIIKWQEKRNAKKALK
ncbi:MAG: protein translocase subunit SecDF [Bacteroidales bacterium]|nr:MAG: protein translocase subunit SecDF [Bacteroidales bacterium]